MDFEYSCFVPMEWNGYSKRFLKTLIKTEATKHWKSCRRLEGMMIQLQDVTAVLVYYNYYPWLKKPDDLQSHPDEGYFGIRMECIICSIGVREHKTVYWVPREWQEYRDLECIVWRSHSQYYRNYGKTEDMELKADGVAVRLENYRNQSWLKKVSDFTEKPDPKSYYSIFVACVYCNRM